MLAQMPLVIRMHPLPLEMCIEAPSVNPSSLTPNLGVSNEVETCTASPVASPDLNDVTTCSEVGEALCHVKSALSHAYAALEHSLTHDIKSHPP